MLERWVNRKKKTDLRLGRQVALAMLGDRLPAGPAALVAAY
jgi:hypothetical protein